MVTLDALRREKKPEILRLAGMYGARNVRIFGLVGLRLDLQELLGATVEVVTPNSLRYIRDRVVAEAQPL